MTRHTDSFSLTVDRAAGAAVVQLAGELDLAAAPNLQSCLDEVLGADTDGVVYIDLDGLTFCDSTGITALVRAVSQAQACRSRLVLRRPRPGVRRVLEITGVTALLDLED